MERRVAESAQLFELLDRLIDGWCERRAIRPLQVLLGGYPPVPSLTDGWAALYATIRHLKGVAPDDLLPGESAAIAEANALIYHLLKDTEAGAQILERAG
jgi:hypothetical protein